MEKENPKNNIPKTKESPKEKQEEYSFDLISPMGCVVIFTAAFFDILNILCIIGSFFDAGAISQIISFIISIIANITFGIWIFFRNKGLKSMPTEKLKEITRKKGKRFILFGIFDLIPYFGDIPSWTFFVFLELKSKK